MMDLMDIRKLQKKLLKEELKRRREKSTFWRWVVPGGLLALALIFGGLIFFLTRLDDSLEEDFLQAQQRVVKGSYQEALEQFQAIHRRHPSFHLAPEALYQSGEILSLYQKKYPEALLAYLTLQKEYPAEQGLGARAQQRIAEIYKNQHRDYRRAVAEYRKLLETGGGGEPDRIKYEIADCYFRLEAFIESREELERLMKEHPTSPLLTEASFRLGTIHSLLGNNNLALQIFRETATRWPESPYATEALFSQAAVLEEKDELGQALQLLQSLQGRYSNTDALNKKIEMLKERMKKKQRHG